MSLDTQQNRKIAREYAAAVASSNEKTPLAVVLIGSVVRGTDTPKSDLDILLVADKKLSVPKHPASFQVQIFTKDRFLTRLNEGDDFTAWTVRFGQPLRGAQYWKSIVGPDPEAFWPSWQRKIPHACDRLLRAVALLKTGDLDAAEEQTLSSADHTARAILLHSNVFPLSRAEMPHQLQQIGWQDLARTLDHLSTDGQDKLPLYIIHLKKTLFHLDKHSYEQLDKRREEVEREKTFFEIDKEARSRVSGHMRLLLTIGSLISKEATRQAIGLRKIEVRPAWSNEYEEDSAVVVDVEVDADVDRRFRFWEDLSNQLNSMTTSLSSRETLFLQRNLSLIVSRTNAV